MKNAELEALDLEGWPLPAPFLEELGRVASLWTTLEKVLDLCLAKLAGFNELNDPTPFILLNHMSMPQRLDALGALCEQLTPHHEALEGYEGVISKIRVAQRERNRFMHDGIAPSEDARTFSMASGSARGKLKTAVKPVAPTDVRRAAAEIHLATLSLYELVLGKRLAPVWERRTGGK